jgi:hypothetical protein
MLLLTNGSSLAGIAALCVSCMPQVPVMAQRSKSFGTGAASWTAYGIHQQFCQGKQQTWTWQQHTLAPDAGSDKASSRLDPSSADLQLCIT